MRSLLLGATALLASGAALAQAPVYDPDQLPAFHGKVTSYSLTVKDEVDGVILDDGTEVHIASRLSSELTFAIKPGDAVTVHGLKATAAAMVQALSIANDASGARIVDTFQPANPPDRPADTPPRMFEARGRIKMPLHAPDGRVDGVLLEDGTIIRLAAGYNPPADCLAAGKDIVATGTGVTSLLGKVMETRSVALDTEANAPGTPGRTVVILPGGWQPTPGQHLPLFNPPSNNNTPAPQH
ncbi:MAG TPA: hypothetical protein VGR70_03680 [Stellaceae bacterium]|nr:hypothetical protein [Stellaceae bacterium]